MSVRIARRGSIASSRVAGTPTTYTIYGSATDGYIPNTIGGADGSGGTPDTTGDIFAGQQVGAAYEGFISFDTSTVVGTITAVTLSLYGTNDSSATDFTLEARIYDWGASLTGANWRSAATLGGLTLAASLSTATWVTSAYNALTSDAAFLSGINKAGSTRLVLCSSRQRNGNSPSGTEYVGFASADASGTSHDPKLVIEALV